jgi:hypothetical protein
MSWIEFRTWLGYTWSGSIIASGGAQHVELLHLEQTPLCRFDAVVLAGLDTRAPANLGTYRRFLTMRAP